MFSVTHTKRTLTSDRCKAALYLCQSLLFCMIAYSFFVVPVAAASSPFNIAYSGRLVDSVGKPITGPVNLTVEFYNAATGGNQKGPTYNFTAVALVDGVFKFPIEIDSAFFSVIFDATGETWVQLTHGTKVYSRQRIFAVPYALRVPVDESTVGFNSSGQLSLKDNGTVGAQIISSLNSSSATISASRLPALSGDVTGALGGTNTVTAIKGVSVATPTADDNGSFLQYNGTSFVLAPAASGASGTVTNVTATPPLTVTSGTSTPALAISQASSTTHGYLSLSDWNTFNSKQNQQSAASNGVDGYLSSTDWATLMASNPHSATQH